MLHDLNLNSKDQTKNKIVHKTSRNFKRHKTI